MELTRKEKAFIYKAWEEKLVRESQLEHDAVFVAQANSFRKKGKPVIPLWESKAEVDVEAMAQLVHEQEKEDISSILRKLRGE